MKLLKSVVLAMLASLVLPSVMQAQDVKADILANETKVWRTFLGTHPDTAAFERLVVPNYLCIEANGVLMTKAENVAQLTHLTFSSFKIQDPQIRVLSPSAALIVARVRFAGTANRHSMSGETLTSTVWVKRGNRWLAQIHTETFTKLSELAGANFGLVLGRGHNLLLEPNWRATAGMIRDWLTENLLLNGESIMAGRYGSTIKHVVAAIFEWCNTKPLAEDIVHVCLAGETTLEGDISQ